MRRKRSEWTLLRAEAWTKKLGRVIQSNPETFQIFANLSCEHRNERRTLLVTFGKLS
jgi:hypothetical protein